MPRQLILWHRWLPPKADEPGRHEALAVWQREVAGRWTVAGGELFAQVAGTVVGCFEPDEQLDVLDMALALLDEADERELPVCVAATLGEISELDGVIIGEAVGRAQLLANRAREGELVLGKEVRHAAAPELLLGRQVSAGSGLARGVTVDRTTPRRSEAAAAIEELRPAIFPPLGDPLLDELEVALTDRSGDTFVLRGPIGAGSNELIHALAERLEQSRVFWIGASPGGVVPLASLRLALLRRFGSPEATREELGDTAARVADGELVPRDELAADLARHLASDASGRAWVVLSPCRLIDGATLAALLDARALGADFALFGRLGLDAELPRPLADLGDSVLERTVPALRPSDARVVAQAIFGPATDADVAKRVAVLGGETVMGVVEAARTLIATGELVLAGAGFKWRQGAREGATSIDTAALLSERLALLDQPARRVLEVLCVMPDGESRALAADVAQRDGLEPTDFERAISALLREALAKDEARPRPATALLRWRVRSTIAPARVQELHRFVADGLAESDTTTRAYYLTEGGEQDAGVALLDRAQSLVSAAGYGRSVRQIRGYENAASGELVTGPARTPPPLEPDGPPSTELAIDELEEVDPDESVAVPMAVFAPPVASEHPEEAEATEELQDELDDLSDEIQLDEDFELDEDDLELIEEDDTSEQPLSQLDMDVDALLDAPLPPPPPPAPKATSIEAALELELDKSQTVEEASDDELALEPEDGVLEAHDLVPPPPEPPAPRLELESEPAPESEQTTLDEPDEALAASPLAIDDDAVLLESLAPDPIEPEPEPALELEEPASIERALAEVTEAPAKLAPALDLDVDALLDAPLEDDEPEPEPESPFDASEEEVLETEDPGLAVDALLGEADPLDEEPTSIVPAPAELLDEPAPLPSERTSVAPAPMSPFVHEAAAAMRDKDFALLEEICAKALEEGVDARSVERVRAVAALARGDVFEAGVLAMTIDESSPADARTLLVQALVALHAGEPVAGVRSGLAALSHARRHADARGEAAALHTLAGCYRALGRDAEAESLEAVRGMSA